MNNLIELGSCDAGVSDSQCKAYLTVVEQTTRVPYAQIEDGLDKVSFKPYARAGQAMSVAEVQRALKDLGFFPGGKDDGICGYRTQSAIRLFQEYLYAVEGKKDCLPDGQFGPKSQGYLRDWLATGKRPHWAATVEQWRAGQIGGEYAQWLAFLERVKQHCLANPNRMLQKVNAYTGATDTRKVADWDFRAAGNIHLIGIRRREFQQRSDDVLVLLIKGLVFKFQGSTEPGAAATETTDPPFLVQGQHHYHFGWHRKTYLALRPLSLATGVLVQRSKDFKLDEADLARPLEVNPTINVHWGGRGFNAVGDWSHGCQVISGSVYIDDQDQLRNCGAYAATASTEPTKVPGKTRGAYNVLLDLVTALGSDLGTTVKYMLLDEPDLALDADLKARLDNARQRLTRHIA